MRINLNRGYLFVPETSIVSKIRMNTLFKWGAFDKVPLISNYLVLPNLECIFLEADGPTQTLAAQLREQFPKAPFMLTPISEADGLLPQTAWDFINAAANAPGTGPRYLPQATTPK
jgi:hypothetical protein